MQLDEKCKIVIETNTKYSAKNSRIEQMSETIIQTDYFCKNLTKYSKEYTKNKTNIEWKKQIEKKAIRQNVRIHFWKK